MRLAPPVAALALAGCLSKPSFDCAVVPGPDQLGASIGTNGGVPKGAEDCGDRSVVGLGFTLTRDTMPSQRTVITALLHCATVSYRGGYETGAIEDVAVPGGSETNVDGPFFADCPAGQVVAGLSAHLVGMGGLFNSVEIKCAALDISGAASGAVTRLPVTATGNEATMRVDADCRPGEALQGLSATGGRELDRVRIACAPTTCTQ